MDQGSAERGADKSQGGSRMSSRIGMGRCLLGVLATLTLVPPAAWGTLSATAGGARDWLKVGKGGKWIELTAPSPALSWDVPIWGEEGKDTADRGLSFSTRFLKDSLADTTGAGTITEYAIDYWDVQDYIEWFARAQFETWDEKLVGEFSGATGFGAGLRFPVVNSTFEVSGHFSRSIWGVEGATHWGLFFGLRLTTNLGGGEDDDGAGGDGATEPGGEPGTTEPEEEVE